MFEAMMDQSDLWKKVLESVKELVNEANLQCSPAGIQMQAMDASHISLVTLLLRSEGFKTYNCARNVNLGINLANMSKILKCANKDDSITLRYEGTDSLTFLVESTGQEKVSEFTMKLMEIDGDSLGIPDQNYNAVVSMPSADFTKLCRDMITFGESVQVNVTRDSVKFTAKGDFGSGSTVIKSTVGADVRQSGVKKEEPTQDTKEGITDASSSSKAVLVETKKDVSLNFALKHLVNFTKAQSLSERVTLKIAGDEPLQVEYKIGNFGYMRYYLAPKVDDAEGATAE
jgi:proliferating cell nuclear antigen